MGLKPGERVGRYDQKVTTGLYVEVFIEYLNEA